MPASSSSSSPSSSTRPQTLIPGRPFIWLTLAAIFGIAAALAWTAPVQASVSQMRPSVVEYSFTYDAELPANPVYEGSSLHYGDIVFLSVVHTIQVGVTWSVPAPGVEITSGKIGLSVLLTSGAGWQRTLQTAAPVSFNESSVSATVDVDFAAALALATDINGVVGVNGPLTVTVAAETEVDGHLASSQGQPTRLTEYTRSDMTFDLTPNQAALTSPASATTSRPTPLTTAATGEIAEASNATGQSSTRPGGAQQPGVQQVIQMVATDVSVPNQLSLWAIDADVLFVRYAATGLAALAAALGLSGTIIGARARQRGEPAYIAARYGARLIPLRSMPDARGNTPFELTNFDALIALSNQLGLPVMVDDEGSRVDYYVADSLSMFRYRTIRPTMTKREERRYRKQQKRQVELDEKRNRALRDEQAKIDKRQARLEREEAELQAKREKRQVRLDRKAAAMQAKLDQRQAHLMAQGAPVQTRRTTDLPAPTAASAAPSASAPPPPLPPLPPPSPSPSVFDAFDALDALLARGPDATVVDSTDE